MIVFKTNLFYVFRLYTTTLVDDRVVNVIMTCLTGLSKNGLLIKL